MIGATEQRSSGPLEDKGADVAAAGGRSLCRAQHARPTWRRMVPMATGSPSDRRGDVKMPALDAEDHECAQCALAFGDITIAQAVQVVTALPGAVQAVVAGLPSE